MSDNERPLLILGSSGQVGWELQRTLAPLGKIVAVDRAGRVDALSDLSDLTRLRVLLERLSPRLVVNAAAYTDVEKSETEEELAHRINAEAPLVLGRWSAEHDVPVIHYSTDYVFDGTKGTPYVETDTPNPLNAYGRTKLAQERVTLEWPAGIVVRTAWLYSPTGRNFVKTILALARERVEEARERASDESLGIANVTPQPTPLTVVDDQVGSPTYAPHLAAGVLELLARGPAPGIYHMAGSGACSWRELARETVIRAGLPVEVHPVTSEEFGAAAPRPAYSPLASERGVPPLPPWHDGVAACVEALSAERQ